MTATTSLSKTCPTCGMEMEFERPTGAFAFACGLDFYCDACADAKIREIEAAEKATRLRERFANLRSRELLTPEFRQASFRASDQTIEAINPEAWAAGRGWNKKQNVYVYGPTGVGKSYLARCLVKRVFQTETNVAEVSARAFCKSTDTFGEARLGDWKSATALLLDDIDKASWTSDRVVALWELLDARSSNHRPTIVTGNVTPVDLRAILREASAKGRSENATSADAALERLRPCLTIHLTGKSQRGARATA
jgi:DNA replication protein DnaC